MYEDVWRRRTAGGRGDVGGTEEFHVEVGRYNMELFMCSARLKDDVRVRWVRVNPHVAPPLDGCCHDDNEGVVYT